MIVDLGLGKDDDLDLVKEMQQRHPAIPALVLSMHDEAVYAERCLKAGARGYVTKQQLDTTLQVAIRRLLDGGTYMSDTLEGRLARPRKSLKILTSTFWFVQRAPKKFIGVETASFEDAEVRISSKEKTLVDCLDHPELAGGGCVNNAAGYDGNACDDGNPATTGEQCSNGVCAVTVATCLTNPAAVAPDRYVDDGDGTVTDLKTCLVWEKKTGTVGTRVECTPPATCPDPNNVNNSYQWSSTSTAADGGAFTDFLAKLNAGRGLAGHTDWRLPTSAGGFGVPTGQPAELESIVEPRHGSPFINTIFGPTATFLGGAYWSSSNYSDTIALIVQFDDGLLNAYYKINPGFCVRAVRGGP